MSRRAGGWRRLALIAAGLLPAASAAAQPPPGTKIAQAERPTIQGPKGALLGASERANVILFFRPGQEHSHATLKMMAECEQEMAGKPVHWAGVVSDKADPAEVKALLAETGLKAPVLIDAGDAIYGALLVALHPMVILVDQKHEMFAAVPFRKIEYCTEVKAWLQKLLGEIDQAAVDKALHPETVEVGGDKSKADRHLAMARKRLELQGWDKAIESARKALELDPKRAAAHGVIARALAEKGECAAAREEAAQAAGDAEAAKAGELCSGR